MACREEVMDSVKHSSAAGLAAGWAKSLLNAFIVDQLRHTGNRFTKMFFKMMMMKGLRKIAETNGSAALWNLLCDGVNNLI